jgi:beta-mannosidase
MNMLRLWSSGAYVPDFMYDMADEMGLMLWSEFQFSVSLYPTSPTFLENVRQEAVYQTRRVNHHPSLAVWAGGNEMEKGQLPAIRKNFPDQYERYLNEYIELFLNTLLPAVYGNSRSIGYMPCSTNNGYLYLDHSLPIPFVNRFYNLTEGKLYGDSDYYDYDAANAFDIDTYVVNRFANEFGFPSMPTIESWREAGLPEDQLRFNSTMVVLRSRHYPPGNLDTDRMDPPLRGQHEMTKGVELWYPIPNKADPIANFSAWCHTTQVFQADFYRAKIQYYRAGSGMPQRQLGALYWQLNDIWSAPTWSGREKSGRWKAMFYAAKDAFQPVILAPVFNVTSGLLDLYAVSELWSDVTGEVSWQWIGYDGEPVVPSNRWPELKPSGGAVGAGRTNFTVGAVNSTVLMTLNMTELTAEGGPLPSDNAILVADLQATGTQPNTDATKTYTHSTYFTAGPLSSAKLVDPGLTLEREDGAFTVTATEGVSAFTWLATDPELDSGVIVVFEDNGFLLRKGESKTVGYRVVGAGSEGWEERVRVSSIWDNTQPY